MVPTRVLGREEGAIRPHLVGALRQVAESLVDERIAKITTLGRAFVRLVDWLHTTLNRRYG